MIIDQSTILTALIPSLLTHITPPYPTTPTHLNYLLLDQSELAGLLQLVLRQVHLQLGLLVDDVLQLGLRGAEQDVVRVVRLGGLLQLVDQLQELLVRVGAYLAALWVWGIRCRS